MLRTKVVTQKIKLIFQLKTVTAKNKCRCIRSKFNNNNKKKKD